MVKGDILKATLKGWNRTQKVLERDTDDIDSGSIHAYYRKLPDESENNRKKSVKPNALHVVLDLAKLSRGGFRGLNHSKGYGLEVKNINTRPSKLREIIHAQKLVIIGWWARVRISSGIFLPSATTY